MSFWSRHTWLHLKTEQRESFNSGRNIGGYPLLWQWKGDFEMIKEEEEDESKEKAKNLMSAASGKKVTLWK